MSAVDETNTATLMGREHYALRQSNRSTSIAYSSQGVDRTQWQWCFQKLTEIQNYENDWNDEGASPIKVEVMALAKQVAKNLRTNLASAPSHTFATDDGSVTFAWDEPMEYIEIEIDKNLSCMMRKIRSGAKQAESVELNPFSLPE